MGNMFSIMYISKKTMFPNNVLVYWYIMASILIQCTLDVAHSSNVFIESDDMVWVKQNEEATIRWHVNNDIDLTTATVDVYSGTKAIFHWVQNTNQPDFYSQARQTRQRYIELNRNSSTLSFKLQRITAADMGTTFKCKLLHGGVSVTGNNGVIVVEAAPSKPLIDASPGFPVPIGSIVSLTCSSTSDPSLEPYSQGLVYEWTGRMGNMTHESRHLTLTIERSDHNTSITCKVHESLSDWSVSGNIFVRVQPINERTSLVNLPTTLAVSDTKTPHSTGLSSARDIIIVTTTSEVSTPDAQRLVWNHEREMMNGIIGALAGLFLLIFIMAAAFVCWLRRGSSKPPRTGNVPTNAAEDKFPLPVSSIVSFQEVPPSGLIIPQVDLEVEDLEGDYSLIGDVQRGPLPKAPESHSALVNLNMRVGPCNSQRQVLNGLVYGNTCSSKNLVENDRARRDSYPSESSSYSEGHEEHAEMSLNISNTCLSESIESETGPNIDGQIIVSDEECTTTMKSHLDETRETNVAHCSVENKNPYTSTPHGSLVQDLQSVELLIGTQVDWSV